RSSDLPAVPGNQRFLRRGKRFRLRSVRVQRLPGTEPGNAEPHRSVEPASRRQLRVLIMKRNSARKLVFKRRLLVSAAMVASALLLTGAPVSAQTQADTKLNSMFEEASRSEAMLRLLMRKMPKGADLHNHASGGVYAEDMMRWAADKGGCLYLKDLSLGPGPCEGPESVPVAGLETSNVDLYNDAIEVMSRGGHGPALGDPTVSGHERFFASFGRFGFGASGERGKVLAVAMEHAAHDNNIYLELMQGPATGVDLQPVLHAEP